MTSGVRRREALDSVCANIQDKSMLNHMLATEAIMRAVARKLGEDEEEWGVTGLLHDIDSELVEGDMSSHSVLGADIARELGASEAMVHAILCHNEAHGVPMQTDLDKALFCVDPLSGLIIATALVRPERLDGMTARSVLKKYNEKSFAASVNREQIARCRDIGLELEEFVRLGVEAMKGVAATLGLNRPALPANGSGP